MNMVEVRRPILVTGAHRSGTTWVGRTIAFDKSVEYINEPFNIIHPFRTRRFKHSFDTRFFYVPNSRDEDNIYQACCELIASGSNPYFRALTISRQNLDIKTPVRFLKHFAIGLINKKRILVKDPIALLSSGWLYENFQFKVICMIRNPVAFVGSIKKRNWSFNFNNLLRQNQLMTEKLAHFKKDIELFSNNQQGIIDQACLLWNILYYIVTEYRNKYPEWIFVRHEDLAKNTIFEYQKIFDYLDLEYTGYIKQKIEDFTADSNNAETDNSFFRARDSKGSLETWKYRLTPAEVDKVIDQTSEIASNFYTIIGKEYA